MADTQFGLKGLPAQTDEPTFALKGLPSEATPQEVPETPEASPVYGLRGRETVGETLVRGIKGAGQRLGVESVAGIQTLGTDAAAAVAAFNRRSNLLKGGVADLTPAQETAIENAEVPQGTGVVPAELMLSVPGMQHHMEDLDPALKTPLNPEQQRKAKEIQKYSNEQQVIGEFKQSVRAEEIDPLILQDLRSEEGQKIVKQMRKELAPRGELPFWQEVLGMGTEAVITSILPGVGLGIVGGVNAGVRYMTTEVFANSYNDARTSGRSPEQALQDATYMAATEGLTEKYPLGFALKQGTSFVKKLLSTVYAESLQENIAEQLQIGYQLGVLDE